MTVRKITIELHGDDDAFDAAFPAVPSSAAADPGMTQNEVIADWIERRLTGRTDRYYGGGIRIVVRP